MLKLTLLTELDGQVAVRALAAMLRVYHLCGMKDAGARNNDSPARWLQFVAELVHP